MTAAVTGDRPYADASEVMRLVTGFEERTLTRAEWTHRAHLTVALWYATRHAPAEALDRVRTGILGLNAALGVVTTPTGGYHETITCFYMRVVGGFLREDGGGGDLAELANRLVQRYGDRSLPRRHYSEQLLWSPAARVGWVEPDLVRLP